MTTAEGSPLHEGTRSTGELAEDHDPSFEEYSVRMFFELPAKT